MQSNLIVATVYPITGCDSVGYVREIKQDENGKYSFVRTNSVERAQLFGAEVNAVIDWMRKECHYDGLDTIYSFSPFPVNNLTRMVEVSTLSEQAEANDVQA
ncbi:hypothetical protein MZD04_gp308 [Pseudomonas phage Psa21]|uniref:Uncharacterized protein n=1 Tax=Pseudomonas phage Psa21 TaxID=2530023 RepID=A0A481W634_9CAUD|nr:hypothetical protein MZD04_gp308 [Pseudomonas phage Psa21]QBJ02834.1 hypothetical protein PSA21_308 [Pseudomonas phage Psa21]